MDQDLEQRKEEEESDQEDAISLCDLSTDRNQESESDTLHQDYEYDDNFDFSFNNPLNNTSQNDTVLDSDKNGINFCGKIIGYNNNNNNGSYYKQQKNVNVVENQRRLKKSASSESQTSQATGSRRYRYSWSKCSSLKHTALIGLVKIPTEMELSDIRKRQSRRRKPMKSMRPVTTVGEPAVAGDNGSGGNENENESERRRNSSWGLVRSLRCGARFANVFAKTAFGCFSLSLVRVYN